MRAAANTEVKKLERFIAQLTLDPYTATVAQQLRHAMRLMPMSQVLEHVRGDNIKIKCEIVGVSRNTWYGWARGEVRPTKRQAQRLAELTGIRAEKFQGRR
jgi:transcriptional regulator with XRE-family HTH domain